MTKVRCTVDNCVYWGSGDVCKASTIWINSNMTEESAGQLPGLDDVEFSLEGPGPSYSRNSQDSSSAKSSSHTCCDTMRPKGLKDEGEHCPHCGSDHED